MLRPLTGYHVLGMFVLGFGIIITVNLTLAYNAVGTFPGLEVKNSYIASQSFDDRRAAQEALGWQATATYDGTELRLVIADSIGALEPDTLDVTLGRTTHVADDMKPAFEFVSSAYITYVDLAPGNWQLRIKATSPGGTVFEQRVPLWVPRS